MSPRDEVAPFAEDAQAADDKTLRLSSIEVGPVDVEAFIRYQRAIRDELEFSPVCRAGWAEHLAEAHRRALEESGLDGGRHARISPIAQDFAGRRMAVRHLKRRLEELRGRALREDESEQVTKLAAELQRLDTLEPLERRHGANAIAALREREEELVALHEQVSPLLARS
jgi:hypothetical protein